MNPSSSAQHPKLTVVVVGARTMGSGIAQVAATAGEKVGLFDQNPEVPGLALEKIKQSLERSAAKGFLDSRVASAAGQNIFLLGNLEEAGSAPVVVEAVKEDLAVKRDLFQRLESIVAEDTLLLSNTSMISISSLAGGLAYPGRLAGAHFFNPVPRMKLVELIAGGETSAAAMQQAREIVVRWGKEPVLAPDSPGFIVNRVFDAIKRESLALLEEGVAPGEIDRALKLGLNFPMGPFELMDLIGLDTTYDCLCNQARQTGRPPEFGKTLPGLVAAGKHGRKSNAGFYEYP